MGGHIRDNGRIRRRYLTFKPKRWFPHFKMRIITCGRSPLWNSSSNRMATLFRIEGFLVTTKRHVRSIQNYLCLMHRQKNTLGPKTRSSCQSNSSRIQIEKIVFSTKIYVSTGGFARFANWLSGHAVPACSIAHPTVRGYSCIGNSTASRDVWRL